MNEFSDVGMALVAIIECIVAVGCLPVNLVGDTGRDYRSAGDRGSVSGEVTGTADGFLSSVLLGHCNRDTAADIYLARDITNEY